MVLEHWNSELNRIQDVSFETIVSSILSTENDTDNYANNNIRPETLHGSIRRNLTTQYRHKRMLILAFIALILASGEYVNIINAILMSNNDDIVAPSASDTIQQIINNSNASTLEMDVILSLGLQTIFTSFLCTFCLYLGEVKRIPLLKLPYLIYMLIVSVQNDYHSVQFLTHNYWQAGFETISILWVTYFLSVDISVIYIVSKILHILFPIRIK